MPEAYLHWQFLCHNGKTEASAFGISDPNDPLLVHSLYVPKQKCNPVFTSIDDDSRFDMVEWAEENGIRIDQINRIWLHTHPEMSADPSRVDEETFQKLANCDYAVMGILSRTNDVYARIQHKSSKTDYQIPIEVLWKEFPSSLENLAGKTVEWKKNYDENITEMAMPTVKVKSRQVQGNSSSGSTNTLWAEYCPTCYSHLDKCCCSLYEYIESSKSWEPKKKWERNKDGVLLVPSDWDDDDIENEEFRHAFQEYMQANYDVPDVYLLNDEKFKEAFEDFTEFMGENVSLDEMFPERFDGIEMIEQEDGVWSEDYATV